MKRNYIYYRYISLECIKTQLQRCKQLFGPEPVVRLKKKTVLQW